MLFKEFLTEITSKEAIAIFLVVFGLGPFSLAVMALMLSRPKKPKT